MPPESSSESTNQTLSDFYRELAKKAAKDKLIANTLQTAVSLICDSCGHQHKWPGAVGNGNHCTNRNCRCDEHRNTFVPATPLSKSDRVSSGNHLPYPNSAKGAK